MRGTRQRRKSAKDLPPHCWKRAPPQATFGHFPCLAVGCIRGVGKWWDGGTWLAHLGLSHPESAVVNPYAPRVSAAQNIAHSNQWMNHQHARLATSSRQACVMPVDMDGMQAHMQLMCCSLSLAVQRGNTTWSYRQDAETVTYRDRGQQQDAVQADHTSSPERGRDHGTGARGVRSAPKRDLRRLQNEEQTKGLADRSAPKSDYRRCQNDAQTRREVHPRKTNSIPRTRRTPRDQATDVLPPAPCPHDCMRVFD